MNQCFLFYRVLATSAHELSWRLFMITGVAQQIGVNLRCSGHMTFDISSLPCDFSQQKTPNFHSRLSPSVTSVNDRIYRRWYLHQHAAASMILRFASFTFMKWRKSVSLYRISVTWCSDMLTTCRFLWFSSLAIIYGASELEFYERRHDYYLPYLEAMDFHSKMKYELRQQVYGRAIFAQAKQWRALALQSWWA